MPKVDAPVPASFITDANEPSQAPESDMQTEESTEESEATAKHEAVVSLNKTSVQLTPIVFVDPTGRSWTFPFETCRTWDVSQKQPIMHILLLTASFRA